ncbi:hypothetical protein QAD02_006177 [Eretmocerus hayati]|uniref:Uncharacterized protein n=1 Tax=Eretmocerus hayati TaxID=131215 RepID=A0ACC2N4B1_9HYME|nr:hypothetical protein QAD02_006177 [Eretmocerus hayati]
MDLRLVIDMDIAELMQGHRPALDPAHRLHLHADTREQIYRTVDHELQLRRPETHEILGIDWEFVRTRWEYMRSVWRKFQALTRRDRGNLGNRAPRTIAVLRATNYLMHYGRNHDGAENIDMIPHINAVLPLL